MGRSLRHVAQGHTVEVTNRTFQARYLLLPKKKLRRIVLGILGRVQRQLDMPIHVFTFVSNHFHILMTPRDAGHMAEFMKRFQQKLSREVKRLYDWPGGLWEGRYSHIQIEQSEQALVKRLRYILSHGVKEGLVGRCVEWPGANCVAALTDGEPLVGTWFERSDQYDASRWGSEVDEEDFGVEEEVLLTPLPCWAHLSEEERRELVRQLIWEIEAEASARHRTEGTRPVGVKKVLAHHPHERPERAKRGPRPWFHAATADGWKRMREAYELFSDAFHHAAELLKAGVPDPPFPEGSFPPGRPFVPHAVPG